LIGFRPYPEHWTLLEIISHLYDEELEDFRQRLDIMLHTPDITPPPIAPAKWVKERNYMDNDFELKVSAFLTERTKSIEWLRSLENPQWDNAEEHRKLGVMTAQKYFENWLAHDLLHIRQIIRVKYLYLSQNASTCIAYAGTW